MNRIEKEITTRDDSLYCFNHIIFHVRIFPYIFSFDVAIKQAKSVDSVAQDELLREAEKLAKLRDHPNVVNIKVNH